jgi:hypothetical protein
LQIIHRVITTFLIKQTDNNRSEAATGAITAPLTFVHQGSQPFLPKPENPRRRTKPEKVRRF